MRTIQQGQCVNFAILPDGNLSITSSEGVNIDDDALLVDLIESQLCNGWEIIRPEECGALTDGLILTQDCERDDHGNLTRLGRVYWHESYAVDDVASMLREGKPIILTSRE